MDSWVPLVFIVLAVAMAVGPVLMLKPSKYQQRLADLRSKALSMGLRVHMLPLEGVQEPVPAYCKPREDKDADRSPWVLLRTGYSHEVNFHNEWAWQKDLRAEECWHERILLLLDSAPAQLLAIGNGPQGLCCYWDERGGEAVLTKINDMLNELSR